VYQTDKFWMELWMSYKYVYKTPTGKTQKSINIE